MNTAADSAFARLHRCFDGRAAQLTVEPTAVPVLLGRVFFVLVTAVPARRRTPGPIFDLLRRFLQTFLLFLLLAIFLLHIFGGCAVLLALLILPRLFPESRDCNKRKRD